MKIQKGDVVKISDGLFKGKYGIVVAANKYPRKENNAVKLRIVTAQKWLTCENHTWSKVRNIELVRKGSKWKNLIKYIRSGDLKRFNWLQFVYLMFMVGAYYKDIPLYMTIPIILFMVISMALVVKGVIKEISEGVEA